jgi:hypothetical protein
LKIWENKERIDTHVFLVYIDVEELVESETDKKIWFLRTIREARSVTLADVHAMYDQQFSSIQDANGSHESGYEALERTLAHRPGLMRMMVVDDGQSNIRLPWICPLPVEVPGETMAFAQSLAESHNDWLFQLRERIAMEWKVTSRHQVFQGWFAKHERACIYACFHAIDLNNHPGRPESHVVMIFLDTDEQVLSEIQQRIIVRHTVQKAFSIPREEVDEHFVSALDQLDRQFPSLPHERRVRMLICAKNSADAAGWSVHPTGWNISPFVSNWPPYDPEWFPVFQRRALIDGG